MIAEDKEKLTIFNELLGVEKMSPQMLKTLLEYVNQSNVVEDLILMLKQDEQCTIGFDEFVKLKSSNTPPAKAMPMTVKAFEETTDNYVKKLVVNRALSCTAIDGTNAPAIKTLLSSVADEPEDVKEVVSRENLGVQEMIQMITVSEEYDTTFSPEIAAELKTILESLDADKANCVFNSLISCSCFVTALKDSDPSILDNLNSLSAEDAALTANQILTDREMRDLLIMCSGNDDAIAKTVGVNTGTC